MRSSHGIAAWLFERLDLDVALLGDLVEEREQRSAIWYWRQVLVAVCAGMWSAIRDHKVLALRAVATGFAMEYSALLLWEHLTGPFNGDALPVVTIGTWAWNLSFVVITQTATGWVVARTHRTHRIAMVSAFLACFSLRYPGPQLFWVIRMLVDWDRIDPAVHPVVVITFVNMLLMVVSALFGGILTHPKKPPSAAHPSVA
jgi:hypothetical protein